MIGVLVIVVDCAVLDAFVATLWFLWFDLMVLVLVWVLD